MNIFYLDKDPKKIAKLMTDKHIVKMVLETGQIFSTNHRLLEEDKAHSDFYRMTHVNHPCTLWARSSLANYLWLKSMFKELSDEYELRFKRKHKTWLQLNKLLIPPDNLPEALGFFDPPQAMPDKYKDKDAVKAYRKYYVGEKLKTDKDKSNYKRWLK